MNRHMRNPVLEICPELGGVSRGTIFDANQPN